MVSEQSGQIVHKKITYPSGCLPKIICDAHPEWVAIHELAMKTAIDNIDYPTQPGWKQQMTCMPGSGFIWQWDSCFMAMYARYANGVLPGMNNLDNLYRLQRDDGYISMAYRMDGDQEAYGEYINPPLYAWVEWEYYQVTGDDSRFASVFPLLIRYFNWIKENRRRPIYDLYWFENPGASGMDNSPRGGYAAQHGDGSDVCFIDLASQQALSALHLAYIADHLGEYTIGERFRAEYESIVKLVNERHWCAKTEFYYDLFWRSESGVRLNFLNHKTAAGFWPIISRIANNEQIDCLVDHLLNPDEFFTPHPVPTLSKDDPNYDPSGGYWLGGVWAPTNYMIVKGLKQAGRHELAREIAVKHLAAMTAVMNNEKFGGIWEAYSPEYLKPSSYELGEFVRPNFVGWSGLGPIAMLIEQIFGLSFSAKDNLVSWRVGTEGRHGIEKLNFNGKLISLICDGETETQDKISFTIITTGPISLRVSGKGLAEQTFTLAAGEHALEI